jgi:transcription initiation factor TFIIIB Brf1 subunit/transcription initiation factor TFIIB
VERAAVEIAQEAAERDIAKGRVHASIAGASLLMACLLRQNTQDARTCKEISDATGAAEATIRLTFKEMYPKRHELVQLTYASKEAIESMSEH